MKSEYRQAVESIIAQKAKLDEVSRKHVETASLENQLAEASRLNQETLTRYQARVAEIEGGLSA